jgi:HAD superfamily hydrolase (TIGR01509 family)
MQNANVTNIVRAVLWDMDGVLVDSAEYHFIAWQTALREIENYNITYEVFRKTFGQRNDTVLRDIFGLAYSDANVALVADHKEAAYRQLIRERGIQPLPGVLKWLMALRTAGWQQAVASAAPRANVDCIVDALQIRSFFGALTSAEDVTRGKPDPQVYLVAAQRVGAQPAQSIVVEDAPAGTEGARRAGMACIGVRSSHGHLQADVVVNSLEELGDDAFEKLISY